MGTLKGKFDRVLSGTKESLTVTREFVILALLLLLFAAPDIISGQLQKAGFVKANIAGFEWENRLQKAAQHAGDTQMQVSYIQQKIDSISSELMTLAPMIHDPIVRNGVSRLTAELDSLAGVARSAEEELKESFQVQQQLLEESRETPIPPAGGWGVVISGDKRLDQAQFEVDRARREGFPNTSIYDRKGWYRTVIEFSSQRDAQGALPVIQEGLNDGAYVVELRSWCGRPTTQTENVMHCSAE